MGSGNSYPGPRVLRSSRSYIASSYLGGAATWVVSSSSCASSRLGMAGIPEEGDISIIVV